MSNLNVIDQAMQATTFPERVDAALALAGLTWGQFAGMSKLKRAHLHGNKRVYAVKVVATYTRIDPYWLFTGGLRPRVELQRPENTTDEDFERLCFFVRILRPPPVETQP